eukprot:gnl/TRDRNA2_/TRDRNA2_84078_c0_seq1.p1 gnl/TRDRNA2_/TRDRNA2_84078_c0~~gnl/TRDRNA2_/TRDRNA2_84078_c0_seq1.p1  ORF type:complete len:244 (-),score=36.91 gnl/TRDRNA2_/TRDRNA2_84078_c0_seq1:162-893(-)
MSEQGVRRIHIDGLGGHLCTIAANSTSTVRDLKVAIREAAGIPPHEQRLIVGTSELSAKNADALEPLLFGGERRGAGAPRAETSIFQGERQGAGATRDKAASDQTPRMTVIRKPSVRLVVQDVVFDWPAPETQSVEQRATVLDLKDNIKTRCTNEVLYIQKLRFILESEPTATEGGRRPPEAGRRPADDDGVLPLAPERVAVDGPPSVLVQFSLKLRRLVDEGLVHLHAERPGYVKPQRFSLR